MSNVACFEVTELLSVLKDTVASSEEFNIKPLIQQASANMFFQYMCSVRFNYNDKDFRKMVDSFDEIFWEINQGYALDFLPWLSPFYINHINTIVGWSTTIRKFILKRIINERELLLDLNDSEADFTNVLLKNMAENKNISRDTIIYMLEDFIGGHSAIGNLVMIALAHIAHNKDIGKKIQAEIDIVAINGRRVINLYDMERMPYTMATISEILRYSSSPIVPHVASENTVVSGYGVSKGTIVFINNYKLNRTSKYWKHPEIFQPERFLESTNIDLSCPKNVTMLSKRRNSEGSDSGVEFEKDEMYLSAKNSLRNRSSRQIHKTCSNQFCSSEVLQIKKNIPHFLPFSVGKRTCIGQSLVRGFGFVLLANILQNYDIKSKNLSNVRTIPACVALPTKTFSLLLRCRNAANNYNY